MINALLFFVVGGMVLVVFATALLRLWVYDAPAGSGHPRRLG